MGEPLAVTSRVDAVTVYRHGALVTRVCELPGGDVTRVKIDGLPLGLDDGSVRVAVRGEGDTLATDVRVALDVPAARGELLPARPADVTAAERVLARIEDELEQLALEARRVAALGVVARPTGRPGRRPPASPAAARMALLALREHRLAAIEERRESAEARRVEAERDLAELRDRERRAGSARLAEPHELRKVVVVALRGTAPATLELRYHVGAARWAPSYVLRLDRSLAQATLEVRAVVCQQTGEDWDRVALMLSTAEPRGWAERPELPALRIGRREPAAPRVGWRPPPIGTDALFADLDVHRRATAVTAAPAAPAVPAGAAPEMAPVRAPEPSPAMGPQAMDPPLMMMPASAAKRSGVPLFGAVAGVVGGAVGAAVEAFSPAPELDTLRRRRSNTGAPSQAQAAASDADDASGVSVASDLLDYGRLRLPAWDAPRRGRLVLATRRELYLALVEEQHLEVDFEAALGEVSAREAAVRAAPLPPACRALAPSGFDYAYPADGRLSAPSDGGYHNLMLCEREGAAHARFVTVPRESRDAFRYVEVDNPLDAPLCDGPIDVYVGGDFLLTSTVRETPPRGRLRLGLGVEERLKVARNSRFAERSGGLMGGRLDLEHSFEVELNNQLPEAAVVEVRERVPVTTEGDDDVEVREVSAEPVWEAWEPDDSPELLGGHRWLLTVPPGERASLRARYVVRIASKHELSGGNRRER